MSLLIMILVSVLYAIICPFSRPPTGRAMTQVTRLDCGGQWPKLGRWAAAGRGVPVICKKDTACTFAHQLQGPVPASEACAEM